MKILTSLLAALSVSFFAQAAEPVLVDVYIDGQLQEQVKLAGANARYQFWIKGDLDTALEMHLIAPEPLIVDISETTVGRETPNGTGRVKLVGARDSFSVVGLKGAAFRHQYTLVRPN